MYFLRRVFRRRCNELVAGGCLVNIRHFPSGKPYREVGDTRIIAKTEVIADWLAGMFDVFESDDTPDIHQRLKRIEQILRNGLPHNDKDVALTIAHAHAEIEQVLEAIDTDGWPR